MSRPTKMVRASRKGGMNSVAVRKRQKIEISQAPTGTSAQPEADVMGELRCGTESNAPSDVELAEAEDKYPIRQLKVDWKSAEKSLHGYSKTQVTRQSK